MAYTLDYTALVAGLSNLINTMDETMKSVDIAIARISAADARMDQLAIDATPILQGINSQAAANPSDEGWQDLKRKRDKAVANGQARRVYIQALIDAINTV